MAEIVEIPIGELESQKDYNEARKNGLTTVERKEPEVEEKPEEKTKPKGGFQKKIDRLIKHNASLEERATAAEKRAQELEAKGGKTETRPAATEPKREEFASEAEWLRAVSRWDVRQELLQQQESARQQEEYETTKELFDAHNERLSAARAKYEDFDEVVAVRLPWMDNNPKDMECARAFQMACFESENGPDVMYHIGKNPEFMEKLEGLTPVKVQREVWKLSEKLAGDKKEENEDEEDEPEEKEVKPPAKPASKAPAPIKALGTGSTKSSVPLDQMSMSDYKKARAAGRRQ